MRTRATTITTGLIAAAALTLTACGSSSTGSTTQPAATTTSAAAKSDAGSSLSHRFGQTYAWPDGVKVAVVQARRFAGYDKTLGEKATPGGTDYQVMVKVTNGGSVPFDLSTLSVITAGATNGGQAAAISWNSAAPPLEGTLAPGVTATKADGETLETQYGKKIVVTVQRSTGDGSTAVFPEFTGAITG